MATIEEALFSILTNDSALSALIGTRVYPNIFPQGVTLPAISYQRISSVRLHSHSGASQLARPRFQLTCLSDSYTEAISVANALREALDGYGGVPAGVRVPVALIQNEFDTYAEENDLHTVRQDYYIWFAEV